MSLMGQLAELLQTQFNPAYAGELDITLEFSWPGGRCRVGVHDGEATFYPETVAAPEPELVLYFRDEALAADILSGRSSAVDAFMRGDFRSNGYIVWTFVTLAAFSQVAE